jgi:hypothetical protein
MKQATQGRTLIQHLKRKALTYAEMMEVLRWQSTSPWKRCVESLRPDEKLIKGKRHMGGRNYLTTWRVAKVEQVSA